MPKKVTKKKKPKTYLNKRGYAVIKSEFGFRDIHSCKKDMTVAPYVHGDFGVKPSPFPIFLESAKKIYLPKHYGLEKFGEPEENRMPEGREIDLEFNGKLRENQLPIIKAFMDTCKSGGTLSSQSYGGVISVGCGVGKTVLTLYLISQLKRKTLIIVHKEFLIEQWIERIKMFLPHARIGLIRQKKVDVLNKDIVIGMLQSISMKNYPEEVFEDFGCCIVDECHHLSAEVFSRALPKIGCKYMCGLSATPKRDDGLSKVFEYYLGPIVYKRERKGGDNVRVNIITINSDNEDYMREELTNYGKVCMSRMINNICEYSKRTDLIVKLVVQMLGEGRKILILSDRRGHLDEFNDKILSTGLGTVGYYVGGMKPKDRKLSEDCDVILGTYSMASEGMDIPSLDSMVLASPKSNIVQPIGRILRKKHLDQPAQVYDIVDNFSHFERQGVKRRRFYKRCKYLIIQTEVTDTVSMTGDDLYKDSLTDTEVYFDPMSKKSPKSKKSKGKKKEKDIKETDICPF